MFMKGGALWKHVETISWLKVLSVVRMTVECSTFGGCDLSMEVTGT